MRCGESNVFHKKKFLISQTQNFNEKKNECEHICMLCKTTFLRINSSQILKLKPELDWPPEVAIPVSPDQLHFLATMAPATLE